ncbi:MAG: SgcJ/EcaC family oxidoreductase [Gemmatimonadaceae bacterium]
MERSHSPARRIADFHQDDESHWVADLACGHTQHVRHDPPWQNRPWVITAEGRDQFLGTTLPCAGCYDEIAALEDRLRAAQLASDVAALDDLIADDLLFTGPDGRLYRKADDLAAHRDGVIRITTHEPQEIRVRHIGDDVAVVALLTRLAGSMAGNAFGGGVRYTRVWAREADGRWRIAAGHVSAVPAEM